MQLCSWRLSYREHTEKKKCESMAQACNPARSVEQSVSVVQSLEGTEKGEMGECMAKLSEW